MSIPRLYHVGVPGVVQSRAFRCIWLLEELDVEDYEVCMITPGQPYGPQLRRLGVDRVRKLPALELGGRVISDSGVVSQVLAERYGGRYMGTAAERIELLEWVGMAETCIMFRIPLLPVLMKADQDIETLTKGAIEPMRAVFRDNVERFEEHFATTGREFLLASGLSIADMMCGWSLHTMHSWGIMDLATGSSPMALDYLERLRARAGFVEAERYPELAPGVYRRGRISIG